MATWHTLGPPSAATMPGKDDTFTELHERDVSHALKIFLCMFPRSMDALVSSHVAGHPLHVIGLGDGGERLRAFGDPFLPAIPQQHAPWRYFVHWDRWKVTLTALWKSPFNFLGCWICFSS